MSQKLKVELQDENGNIYYLHTAADVVVLDDGTTVEAALEKKVNASGGDISNTKLATLAAESASFPVPAAGDAPKTLWGKAKKWQQDCLAKFANYVLTSAITNQYLNDTSKIPTAALMYLLKQEVNGLNSDAAFKAKENIFSKQCQFSKDADLDYTGDGYRNSPVYIYGHYATNNSARAQISFENDGKNAIVLYLDIDNFIKIINNNGEHYRILMQKLSTSYVIDPNTATDMVSAVNGFDSGYKNTPDDFVGTWGTLITIWENPNDTGELGSNRTQTLSYLQKSVTRYYSSGKWSDWGGVL